MFDNVQSLGLSKQINHILAKQQVDILAETRHNDDHHVVEKMKDYIWIGKNRSSRMGGGVGFMVNTNKVSVNEIECLNSRTVQYLYVYSIYHVAMCPT